ncbi:MAG: AN1-type zinc finger domain-containing protein [Nitrososphaerales archaeon]
MNCQYCGKEESLPFVCNYCGGVFCGEHRLPESHNCTGDLSHRPVVQPSTSTFSWSDSGATVAARNRVAHTFSAHEVRDIIIAWLGLGIAFSLANTGGLIAGFADRVGVEVNGVAYYFSALTVVELSLATVGAGFVLHELMHKFSSQRYGFQAEFRMWPQGLALALVLSAFSGFVFAAPGATYIDGYGIKTRENGIISIAGPLTNIVIAILFFPLVYYNGGSPFLFEVGYLGSYINVFLAAFNMLPIMPLDGAKVWRWNKLIWIGVFGPLALLLISYFLGIVPAI